MESNEMKCFYKELDRRKKYLITKLNNEIATLEWQWFQQEITDKEYVVAFDDIQRRIRELEGQFKIIFSVLHLVQFVYLMFFGIIQNQFRDFF